MRFFAPYVLFGLIFTHSLLAANAQKEHRGEGFSLTREFSYTKKLIPNQYRSTPTLRASEYLRNKPELSSQEKGQITHTINKILERTKQESFCKGGSYSLEPLYEFHDGRQKLIGHELNLQFSCTLKSEDISRFNALINEMDHLASESGFLHFLIPPLHAQISAGEIDRAKENAYEELLILASKKATHYSKVSARTCTLAEVNFDDSIDHEPRAFVFSTKAAEARNLRDSMELTPPLAQEEDISLSAHVRYRCK
ncbi:MAG: hypothetical protein ACTTH5_02100 [Wolinella sp.]